MEKICDIKKCLGCFACKNICPQNSIIVSEDYMGKIIPKIDGQKCVDCGLCEEACPVNRNSKFHKTLGCYAAYTKNALDRVECASGGLASAFARKIFERNGIIVGAVYENGMLKQKLLSEKDNWELIKGSKYVQSYVDMSYRDVKKALVANISVVYIGTPCQIDGLYGFLDNDYSNLLTVDLICHGTPPMRYLREYCSSKCEGKDFEKISFRGRYDNQLVIYGKNSVLYRESSKKDVYYRAFLGGLIQRDNCYECPYSRVERIADITIGDFWGFDWSTSKLPKTDKISVMLIQTEKGLRFFDELKEKLYWEERSMVEVVKGNMQLCQPLKSHRDRNVFLKNYPLNGFSVAVSTPGIKKDILKSCILETRFGEIIRKCIKRK